MMKKHQHIFSTFFDHKCKELNAYKQKMASRFIGMSFLLVPFTALPIKKQHFLFYFFLLAWMGCEPPSVESKLYGVWIGNYQSELYAYPLPQLLYFEESNAGQWLRQPDSLLNINWEWSNDMLFLDTSQFVIQSFEENKIHLQKDEQTLVFQRLPLSKISDSLDIAQLLIGHTWAKQTNSQTQPFYFNETLALEQDTLWIKRDYWYDDIFLGDELESACYAFQTFQNQHFLFQSTRTYNCDSTFMNPIHILTLHEESFNTVQWVNKAQQDSKFIKTHPFKKDPNHFRLCRDLYTAPYYRTLTTYQGNKRAMTEQLIAKLPQELDLGKQSGYITFRFYIDCQGNMGRFDLQQSDLNFDPITFDKKIIKHLFTSVQNLKDWKAGKNDEGERLDCHKFITFKIVDEQIVDILP